jgi:hypothetical protein
MTDSLPVDSPVCSPTGPPASTDSGLSVRSRPTNGSATYADFADEAFFADEPAGALSMSACSATTSFVSAR